MNKETLINIFCLPEVNDATLFGQLYDLTYRPFLCLVVMFHIITISIIVYSVIKNMMRLHNRNVRITFRNVIDYIITYSCAGTMSICLLIWFYTILIIMYAVYVFYNIVYCILF